MYSKQTKLNVYWKLISNLVPLGSIMFEMETLNKSVPKSFLDKKLRHDYNQNKHPFLQTLRVPKEFILSVRLKLNY